MTSGFVAVVPKNKLKSVIVYEVRPASRVHDLRELLMISYDTYQNRFPVLADRLLEFEQHWFWPRRVKWSTVRYEDE